MRCDKCKDDITTQGTLYYTCRCGTRYCVRCGHGRTQCDSCGQWNTIEEHRTR